MNEKELNDIRVDCGGITKETHPFNNVADLKGAKYLIVGTFPPHRFGIVDEEDRKNKNVLTTKEYGYEVFWFYGSKNNEMWGVNGRGGLLQTALGFEDIVLDTKKSRIDFCQSKHIAFLDLFQVIYRFGESASDLNIFPIEKVDLVYYLRENSEVEAVFFTSEWVMDIAKKEYKRQNKAFIEKLCNENYVIKSAKNQPKLERDCVIGNVFVLEGENMPREISIYALKSPSSSAKISSDSKLEQWKEVLSGYFN